MCQMRWSARLQGVIFVLPGSKLRATWGRLTCFSRPVPGAYREPWCSPSSTCAVLHNLNELQNVSLPIYGLRMGFGLFFFFVTAYLRFYPRHRWPHLSGTTSSRCKCASFQGFRVSGNRQANYMLLRISFPGSFPHTPSHVAALVHRPSKLLRCIFIFCVFFFLLLEFEAIEVKKWSHGSAPNTWRPMRIRRFVPIIWWAHVPFAGRTSQFRDCRGSYINTSHICAIWVSVTGATCRGHSPRPKLRSHPRCEASGLLRQRILPLYVTRKFFRQIIGEKDALSLFTLAAEWRQIQKYSYKIKIPRVLWAGSTNNTYLKIVNKR